MAKSRLRKNRGKGKGAKARKALIRNQNDAVRVLRFGGAAHRPMKRLDVPR